MNNSKSLLSTIMMVLVIVLMVVGGFLYLGSYFWGFFFIMAAAIVFFVRLGLLNGIDSVKQTGFGFLKQLSVPFFGIFFAIFLAAVIMLFTGYNPLVALKALFYGGFIKNWHVAVLNATPLIFTGLSIAIAFKAGLFNIGAEGQYYIGVMASTWLGLRLGLPGFIVIPLIFILAGACAAAYNVIPSLLKVKTGASEVITTMMFAHIARYLSPIFIRANGGDPSTSTHAYVTDPIAESAWLPPFKNFLPEANYRLHTGIIIAILMAFVVSYFLYKTKYGFEIRAVGQNKDAARAQGISVGKNIMRAMLFAGLLAGMAGVTETLGLTHKMFDNLNAGYGWNGISVALLASNNPIAIIFTSLLWGALDAGGQYMTRTTQVPNSIVEIIKGIILFLIVAKYIYSFIGNRFKRGKKSASGGSSAEDGAVSGSGAKAV
ncbi:MAG: ABC transporter permease [Spirochaetales bacterium]|nr:ABC transporter permease [Spirochaetales bacterium]